MTGRTGVFRSAEDNLPLAVGTIVFTVFALSLGDAAIKLTSGHFALWQVFVLRSIIAVPVLLAILRTTNHSHGLLPGNPGWVALRSLMLVAMWVCYYASLPHLQLSVAAAAYYTLPLFITLFAALFTGDRITTLGWVAVSAGFVGVLLILRPDADGFGIHALLPLVAAMLYGGAMLLTRTKCRAENPLVLSLHLNLAFIIVGLAATALTVTWGASPEGDPEPSGLLAPWAAMNGLDWLTMGLLAGSILIGSIGAAVAYQNAPPSVIGTFDFAYVAFSTIWGLLWFGEVPGTLSLAGIALIVLAGIVSVRQTPKSKSAASHSR
ncbi:DMT family transporter [Hwanghaeella grinnelliae]|uniref:DMT family transporter n=1 Tax=Hwanghaeella grinnelliae TaxID=2500179 RepID=A0A437QX30_9PROT|nr:DMT family transporter [Hwanghaeella grinnelliae]RVU39087.1 DMT family transporter [Hwanghaeella grinnelliae]